MTLLLLAALLGALSGHGNITFAADDRDIGLNTVEMIEKHGYPVELHNITTEDGYINTFQRIPHGLNDDGTAKRPAVLLMHAITSSSADFVNMGPERSLGYILADLGFDVWIGNARGTFWSRHHTTLDPVKDAEAFFDFTWHEIGVYDVASAIDHILELNGDASLSYIGHSQGCTALFALTATKPEYNDKIKIASLMAPASIMEHLPTTPGGLILEVASKYVYEIEALLNKFHIYEVPLVNTIRTYGAKICGEEVLGPICQIVTSTFTGYDPDELESRNFPVIFSNAPSETGFKQFYHYGQLLKNGGFSQYDHGSEKNLQVYGAATPPEYDFSEIKLPVALYYGQKDGLVNYQDVETLHGKLPNVVDFYLVPYENWAHREFLFGKDVVDLVYTPLIKVLQQYQ